MEDGESLTTGFDGPTPHAHILLHRLLHGQKMWMRVLSPVHALTTLLKMTQEQTISIEEEVTLRTAYEQLGRHIAGYHPVTVGCSR